MPTLVSQVFSHTQHISGSGSRQVTAMGGKFFVGGNWKCNETVAEVKQLVEELNAGTVPGDIEVVVAPTYIHLAMVLALGLLRACPTPIHRTGHANGALAVNQTILQRMIQRSRLPD